MPRARARDRGARPRPARRAADFDEVRDADAWAAAGIPGSPFAVALDEHGTVLAKGTFNTPAPARVRARHRGAAAGRAVPERVERPVAADVAARVPRPGRRRADGDRGRRTAASLIAPGEAEAYHFCGHIYTTDSCPHPTGLPRIDSAAARCARGTATASTTSAA